MRLRREEGREYWELSEEEVAQRLGLPVPDREVSPDLESPAVEPAAVWGAEPSEGIELHASIAEDLSKRGLSVFSGSLVRVSPGLQPQAAALRAKYESLHHPSFGREGATSFFGGRKLLAFKADLLPGEADLRNDKLGFLASLFTAVIRTLPDYSPAAHYPLSWILTRHDRPVEAMPFHHDRVGWLAQFNIDRSPGVSGGSIQLRSPGDGSIVASSSLKEFLDGYIVRDDTYEHGTSGMTMAAPGQDHRDVLVLRLPAFGSSE